MEPSIYNGIQSQITENFYFQKSLYNGTVLRDFVVRSTPICTPEIVLQTVSISRIYLNEINQRWHSDYAKSFKFNRKDPRNINKHAHSHWFNKVKNLHHSGKTFIALKNSWPVFLSFSGNFFLKFKYTVWICKICKMKYFYCHCKMIKFVQNFHIWFSTVRSWGPSHFHRCPGQSNYYRRDK